MNIATFLQIFLIIDVFIAGALVAIAAQHYYAHKNQKKSPPPKVNQPIQSPLPPAVKEEMLKKAETDYQKVLTDSATKLQDDMEDTSIRINKLLDQMGTKIVGDELQRYATELNELRAHAVADISGIQNEIANHQAEIKAQLDKELASEKQKLIQQLDTKLADAVGSFLLETLQHNVDLGAQSAYLTALLEEHKAEFIKEVADDQAKATG